MNIAFKKALAIAKGLGFTGSAHAELTKFLSDRSESARIGGEVVALKALQVSQPDAATVTVIEVEDDAPAGAAPDAAMSAKSLKDELRDLKIAFYSKIDEVTKSAGKVEGRPNVMPEVTGGETPQERIYNNEVKAGKKKAFNNAKDAEAFGAFVLKSSGMLEKVRPMLGADAARVSADCDNILKSYRPNVRKDYTTGVGSVDGLTGVQFVPDLIRLFDSFGVAAKYANVINGSDQMVVRTRNLSESKNVSYPSEGGTSAIADSSFITENMRLRRASAVSAVSIEALKWSRINLGESIAVDFARFFAYQEDQNVFYGDGTSTYGGMLGLGTQFTAAGTQGLTFTTAAGVANTTGAGWASHSLTYLQALKSKLPNYIFALGNPCWFTTRQYFESVMMPAARAAGGNSAGDIATFTTDRFLGLPVVFTEVLSRATTGITTASTVAAFVGDLSMGVDIARGGDLTIESDTSVGFANGLVYFRGTMYHDVSTSHAVGTTTKAGPIGCIYNAS